MPSHSDTKARMARSDSRTSTHGARSPAAPGAGLLFEVLKLCCRRASKTRPPAGFDGHWARWTLTLHVSRGGPIISIEIERLQIEDQDRRPGARAAGSE